LLTEAEELVTRAPALQTRLGVLVSHWHRIC
jgi:hypothetical protein